jgi:hypothetical protein
VKTSCVADAWSLDPIGELRLGDRLVPVPPLTFGRFQRLLALPSSEFIRAMATGDVAAAFPWAEVVIPGLSRTEWEGGATAATIGKLFMLFTRGHDWAFIGDAIRFVTRAAGLLAIARASGHRIGDLVEMRLEGFHLLVETLRRERESGEEQVPQGGIPEGFGYAPDASGLLEKLKAAEEAASGRDMTEEAPHGN